ncbi:MAG: hypothetical protein PHV49_00220 [Alistipes sp.]|nr:hypothetical protein [Alistipes sp.]
MKNTKTLLLCLALFGFVWPLRAGDLRLHIVMGEETLGYAYVSLNGKVVGVADAQGTLTLSASQLTLQDTISVSYVGTLPASVVYTEALQASSEYTFQMQPDQILDMAEVTAKFNAWRFFRKSVRKHLIPDWWCEESGIAELSFTHNGRTTYALHTPFYYGIIPTRDGKSEAHTRTQVTETLPADPQLQTMIYTAIFHSLWRITEALYFEDMAEMNTGVILQYRGEQEGKRHFVLARHVEGVSNYQLLLIVDKQSREVESATLELLYPSFDSRLSCKAQFQVQQLSFKQGESRAAIYPSHIHGEMRFSITESTCNFDLSAIQLREYSQSEKQRIEAERDSHTATQPLFRREALLSPQ